MRVLEGRNTGRGAVAMLSAFASVGTRAFDVTLTNIEGKKVRFKPNSSLEQLRRTIGSTLQQARRNWHNVVIRPRSTTNTLIQLDDLDSGKVERISAHAFLVIRTSPGNYQVWIAVKHATPDFTRRLRKGAGADLGATGAARISGSLNFKSKYAPDFPIVETINASAGKVVGTAELENGGFVAAQEEQEPHLPAPLVAHLQGSPWRWPDYERCVRGAPSIHRGHRPDISRADFTWCRTAIQWGWSVEETASRLMEFSNKARENGERYALRTATRAAESVEPQR